VFADASNLILSESPIPKVSLVCIISIGFANESIMEATPSPEMIHPTIKPIIVYLFNIKKTLKW
jgi:hypothetical protein